MSSTQSSPGAGAPPDAGLAGIEIRRTRDWFATWRRLSIRIDGAEAGAVGYGRTTRLGVAPGRHTVRVSVDWIVRTPEVVVEVAAGEVAVLEVGQRQRGWRLLLSGIETIVRPHKVLYLRRIDGGQPEAGS